MAYFHTAVYLDRDLVIKEIVHGEHDALLMFRAEHPLIPKGDYQLLRIEGCSVYDGVVTRKEVIRCKDGVERTLKLRMERYGEREAIHAGTEDLVV